MGWHMKTANKMADIFADNIFKFIFLNEKFHNLVQIWLKYVGYSLF